MPEAKWRRETRGFMLILCDVSVNTGVFNTVCSSLLPHLSPGSLWFIIFPGICGGGEGSRRSNYITCGIESIVPSLASHIPQCSHSHCCLLMRLSVGLWPKTAYFWVPQLPNGHKLFLFFQPFTNEMSNRFPFSKTSLHPLWVYPYIRTFISWRLQWLFGWKWKHLQHIILNSVLPVYFH